MGQKFRDQAGNIWEMGANGQPVYVSGPQGAIQTKPADPTQQYKAPAAAANLTGQELSNQRTGLDIQNAPIEREGKVLNNQGQGLSNQRTAQDIKFDQAKTASALASQFATDQRVKDYRTVLPMMAAAMNADKGKQGDLSVVYAWAKAMDPAGSVREGDTDLANSSSSYIQQARQWIAKIDKGQGLDPQVRKGLIGEIRNKAIVLNQAYGEARNQYGALAQQGDIDPNIVIGPHDGVKYQGAESGFLGRPVQGAADQPAMTPTAGQTSTQFDAGKTARLDAFIKSGAPFAQANKWVTAQGGDPIDPRAYAQAVRFAKSNPNYNGSLAEFTVTTRTTPTQQALGSIVGTGDIGFVKGSKEALDRAAVGAQSLYNAIPGLPDSNSASEAQQQTQQFFQDKAVDPTGETLGRLAGASVLTAPIRGPMAAGAAGNLLMSDSTGMDAVKDAALGAAGGKVADILLRGGAALAAPQGRDAMRRLAGEGVRFSPGQMFGGAARNIEDRLTANPVLGPRIDAIREQGIEQANRIPANRALAPIGQRLPDNVPAGHEAVAYTQRALGNAYDNALNGALVAIDPTYVTRMNAIGQRSNMRPQEFGEFADTVQREVGGAFQRPQTPLGAMTGRDYKQLDSRLGKLIGDYGRSTDVFARDIADGLQQVKDQTRALVRRQNPAVGAQLRAADEGYANYKILERAAASNPATGLFGAGQLRTAIRGADRSVGKGATARGEARMQDLASDMSETMPSTIGSSGTSEREQVNKLAPWVLGTMLSPLYSPPMLNMTEQLMLRQAGPGSQRIARGLRALPRGMFGAGAPLLIESGQ